jgi:hypothetical protein
VGKSEVHRKFLEQVIGDFIESKKIFLKSANRRRKLQKKLDKVLKDEN